MSGRALTPAMVAEMWGCSERTVRNEIAAGRLRHFRVGQKLLRIPREALEEYECRRAVSALDMSGVPSGSENQPGKNSKGT
jgi:excisionase family DNA binding protein